MGADVPEPLRLAVRHLVTQAYEKRGDMPGEGRGLPPEVATLLQPFRPVRL
jgi:uncharacterized phiE125 gp8 family phage protein